ncbi:hypothetical protein [Bacillus phage BC-T25]|nr:hypothetical protein [Bacillus phage BC-T25]
MYQDEDVERMAEQLYNMITERGGDLTKVEVIMHDDGIEDCEVVTVIQRFTIKRTEEK